MKNAKRGVNALRAMGGTTMSRAVEHSTAILRDAGAAAGRMRRALFLTDLESMGDQHEVVSLVKEAAREGIYTSVLGVDVDLSVHMVEQISCTKGARYTSVTDKRAFIERLTMDFDHDVTPVAFDIGFQLQGGVGFSAGYGTPELAGLASGSKASLVTEFACSELGSAGAASGNIVVFKLAKLPARHSPLLPSPPTTAARHGSVACDHDTRTAIRQPHRPPVRPAVVSSSPSLCCRQSPRSTRASNPPRPPRSLPAGRGRLRARAFFFLAAHGRAARLARVRSAVLPLARARGHASREPRAPLAAQGVRAHQVRTAAGAKQSRRQLLAPRACACIQPASARAVWEPWPTCACAPHPRTCACA